MLIVLFHAKDVKYPNEFISELEKYGKIVDDKVNNNYIAIGYIDGCDLAYAFTINHPDKCSGLYLIDPQTSSSIKQVKYPTFIFNRLNLDPDILIDKKDTIESDILKSCRSNIDKFVFNKELRLNSKSIVESYWYPESIDNKGQLVDTDLYAILDVISNNIYRYIPKSISKPKKAAKRIILITGTSGSGKTTLGNRIKELFKDYVIVDSDEIDDEAFLELYKNNPVFKHQVLDRTGNPEDMHFNLTRQKRDEILNQNKDKTIVFVGHTVELDDVIHEGYHLYVDPETNFKRLNIRTLDDMCSNLDNIKKLFEEEDPRATFDLALFKYKIRTRIPLPYEAFESMQGWFMNKSKDRGYKIMTSDEIIKDMQKLKGGNILNHNKDMYSRLKNIHQMGSGESNNLIIHVTGAQGSGKTTLGSNLKSEFGSKIHVIDLDDLHGEFNSQSVITDYQNYIDKYILDHSDKPLIIVGLDAEKCLGEGKSNNIYDMHTSNLIYIKIDQDTHLRDWFYRQTSKLCDRKEQLYDNWKKNKDDGQKKLFRLIDLNFREANNLECDKLYKERGYKFMSRKDAMDRCRELID